MKINKWLFVIFAFVSGIFVGFLLDEGIKPEQRDYDNALKYLEKEVIAFPGRYGNSEFNDYVTMGRIKKAYFEMKPVTSSVLMSKVKSICTKVDWENVPEKPIDDVGEDICLNFCGGYFNATPRGN